MFHVSVWDLLFSWGVASFLLGGGGGEVVGEFRKKLENRGAPPVPHPPHYGKPLYMYICIYIDTHTHILFEVIYYLILY